MHNENAVSSKQALTLALAGISLVVIYLCYLILKPFFSVLSWAVALSIVTYPLYRWLRQHLKNRNLAALVTTTILALGIVLPAAFLILELIKSAAVNIAFLSNKRPRWEELVASHPVVRRFLEGIEQYIQVSAGIEHATQRLNEFAAGIFTGSLWSAIEMLLVIFTVFFLYRDQERIVGAVRHLIPLSTAETDKLFQRVEDTIYATLYGKLVVSAVQGTLGGLMFFWLGLPSPLFWGFLMAVLSLIPYLGAFIVWVPAAIYFLLSGSWLSALILTLWGSIVIALIDNLLYPMLVGQRLHFHTLPLFFFIIGGVLFFGAAGIVLGPVILAVGDALLEIWKRRIRMPLPAAEKMKTA